MADPAPPKAWWRSKTLWIAVLQVAAAILVMPHLGLKVGTVLALKGILDIILRVLTTTPIEGVRSD